MRNKAKNCKRWKRKTNRKTREEDRRECVETMANEKRVGVATKLQLQQPFEFECEHCENDVVCWFIPLRLRFLLRRQKQKGRKWKHEETGHINSFQLFYRNENNWNSSGWLAANDNFVCHFLFSETVMQLASLFFRTSARKNFYLEFIAQKRTTKQWVECHVQKGHSWKPIENGRTRDSRRVGSFKHRYWMSQISVEQVCICV